MNQLNLFDNSTVVYSHNVELFSHGTDREIVFSQKREKIYDLTKDKKTLIRESQQDKGISSLADISFNLDNCECNYLKKFEYVIKRISSKVIGPAVQGLSNCEKINTLIDLANGSNWEVEIEYDDLTESDQKLCLAIIGEEFNQVNIDKYVPIRITISNITLDYSFDFYSILNKSIKKNYHKTKRYIGGTYHTLPIVDLGLIISEFYLYKQLYKFTSKNKDVLEYAIVQYLLTRDNKVYLPKEYEDNSQVIDMIKKYFVNPNFIFTEDLNEWGYDYLFNLSIFNLEHICDQNLSRSRFFFASNLSVICIILLKEMININQDINREVERRIRLASDYAKIFETKKNISLKVQQAMKSSSFNTYFNYVEFDQDVDLKKMKQIEDEFVEFATRINFSKYDSHSIRFRKLGQHRAKELYFPYYKAICIDLTSPKYICHGVAHMIDWTHMEKGRLSELYDFKVIADIYKTLVQDAINSLSIDNPVYIKFYSTSKYNRNYYFSNEEIFARTMEIYFSEVLKFDNSLLNKGGVYYPTDSTLISCIEDYFGRIFINMLHEKLF